ncbi:MAG: CvpA family protein, partial [Phycisphaerales bacterium]|nr:CvpA family protein [Phycisphaerales bacterium]
MLFSLIVALMVILVAAFWTYQGFFSSAIMFFETLLAAMLAFAFYESLNSLWAEQLGDGLGQPIALMVIFVASLTVFRTLTDRYVTHDVELPLPVARGGGAICGFFSGMLLVGMALIAIQMLPIGSEIFAFERMSYDKEKGGPAKMSGLGIFTPDAFTYGLISSMSDGAKFGTDSDNSHSLRHVKADLIKQLYSRRAAPQWEARVFLEESDLEARAYWEERAGVDIPKHELGERNAMIRTFETRAPKGTNKFLVCTVVVKKSAAPEGKNQIRFRLPQFRVVGYDNGNEKQNPSVYLASGMSDIYVNKHTGPTPVADQQRERLVGFSPLTNFILDSTSTSVIETENGYQFDVAFEVPDG